MKLEGEVIGVSTNLIDIATPGVDTRPWFLYQASLAALPVPRRNPLTGRNIVSTMNLAESWRYWRNRGLSAADFDSRLTEAEPVELENGYTVTREVAQEFLRERGISDERVAAILQALPEGDINVAALLAAMAGRAAQTAAQPTPRDGRPKRQRDPRCPIL